jgi:hypothetical protein
LSFVARKTFFRSWNYTPILLVIWLVVYLPPVLAQELPAAYRSNIGVGMRLRVPGFAEPHSNPYVITWSLTTLDTTGKYGTYRGLLDDDWDLLLRQEVEERNDLGYARFTWYSFKRIAGIPYVTSLDAYREMLIEDDLVHDFRESSVNNIGTQRAQAHAGGLNIQLPTRIRSKTFRRIFGGDRVGLNVTGDVSINGGFRRDSREQLQSNIQQGNTNYNFTIDQSQRFTIVGQVGDKVSVRVDQDSERLFEFQNAIKLEYTGYEDEIIQKIEAGNVDLSLPSTRLAAFSAQNRGLFGLKSQLKVGPLKLTSIASLEKGEKNKITVSSGATQSTQIIYNTQPRPNTYFFVDNLYRDNFRYFTASLSHRTALYDSSQYVRDFDLYKSVPIAGGNNVGTISGWAVYDPINTNFNSLTEDQNHQHNTFQLMQPTTDYIVDPNLGYIRLTTAIGAGTVLACAYRTSTDTIGDITAIAPQPGDTTEIHLKLLRPQNPVYTDSTWNLMFRNVYYLYATNIVQSGFDIKIKFEQAGSPDEEDQQTPEGRLSYLTIFGLDRQNTSGVPTPDGVIDNNPSIIDWQRGEIIFPDLRPFDPEGYYINDQLTGQNLLQVDRRTPAIYDTSGFMPQSNFKIEVKYANVSSVFPLGFNVLENSEEVYLNGARMNRGTDYTIDYMSGQLLILNQAALAPGADLEILYESGSIFQLDKKTLLGTRAEYELWNEQSFVGGTLLYLNEKPLDQRVRVGSEPMRNFLWDVNSSMVFKPSFLTDAVDALPLVESDAESRIAIEGEVAKVYPNPNSLNSPSTGDNSGVAYVDDFESIKRATPLGIMRRAWTLASYPTGAVDADSIHGAIRWYNPYEQVFIQEIWPDREVNANVAQKTNVLTVQLHPDTIQYDPNLERRWNGIMRYLPAGYNDQSDAKYIEIWLKNERRNTGKLYIDLGQISEDVIPNDTLNTEDRPVPGSNPVNPRQAYGNGILDEGEDVGLDGHAGTDPIDHWYINGLGNPSVPSLDDWSYTVSDYNNYDHINGTEGNADDENGRYPDTEDLDGDGYLDLADNFFRYGFEFNNPQDELRYIAGGQDNPNGWRLYRIPLTDTLQTVGQPYLTQIQYARIWMTGFTSEAKVSIASIELVGNDWRETVQVDSGGDRDYLSVAVVNTHDNADYYSPPGVLGEVDPITEVRSKEQSLALQIHGLPPQNPAWVTRTLYTQQSLIEYRKLKMFVHGGGSQIVTFPEDQVEFLFKFGADTSSNYYEYIETLYPGWDTKNEIDIDFDVLTALKLDRPSDTTRWGEVYNSGGDSILVQGNPSLTNIRYLAFGVRRKHREPPVLKISTEIWLDELRVSDVYRDAGLAGRASMTVNFADLANFSADINAQQAEFHNINIRTPGSGPQNLFNQSYSGTLQLNKIFNPRWGLNIPLNANYSRNVGTPKYYPGSDILVDRNNPADSVKTIVEERGASINYSKTTPSSNVFVRHTLDKITAGYGLTRRRSSNPTTLYSKTNINSANVGYTWNINQGNGLGIFSFTQKLPFLSRLADSRFYYKPTHINLTLNGSENETRTQTRSGVFNRSYSLLITRTLGTGVQPFQNLSLDVTRTHRSDLSTRGVSGLLEGDFGRDNNVSQAVNASYSPQVFSFLDTDASYRTNYGWSWGNNYAESGQTVTNQNTLTTTMELKTQDIVGRWAGRPSVQGKGGQPPMAPRGGEKGGTQGPIQPEMAPGEPYGKEGASPILEPQEQEPQKEPLPLPRFGEPEAKEEIPTPPPKKEEGKTGEEPQQKPEQTKKNPPPSLLDGVKFLLSRLGNVRFDYSLQNNLTHPTVSGQANWRYQLGFARSPGVPIVSDYTAIPSDARTDDYRVGTVLNMARDVRINLDYDFRKTKNLGSTNNGSTEQTHFFILNRSQVKATDFFLLNWNLSWAGLERTPVFQNLAQSVSFDNAFNGTRNDQWTGTESNITRTEYTRSFNPLAGFTINWKGGINSSIRYTLSQTLSDQITGGTGKTYTTQTGLTAQVTYSRQSGFRIPLPFWPFKNRRFSNQTNFTLQFNMTSNRQEGSIGEAGALQENSRQDSWSVSPRIDYTFSNTVTGGIHFETGVNKDKIQGRSTFMDFGVSVNIAIRG